MLNGISNAASTLGRQLVGIASRVSSAGGTGFSVAPQAVRLISGESSFPLFSRFVEC